MLWQHHFKHWSVDSSAVAEAAVVNIISWDNSSNSKPVKFKEPPMEKLRVLPHMHRHQQRQHPLMNSRWIPSSHLVIHVSYGMSKNLIVSRYGVAGIRCLLGKRPMLPWAILVTPPWRVLVGVMVAAIIISTLTAVICYHHPTIARATTITTIWTWDVIRSPSTITSTRPSHPLQNSVETMIGRMMMMMMMTTMLATTWWKICTLDNVRIVIQAMRTTLNGITGRRRAFLFIVTTRLLEALTVMEQQEQVIIVRSSTYSVLLWQQGI